MKIEQSKWTAGEGWVKSIDQGLNGSTNFVLAFGGRDALSDPARYNELRGMYPNAHILMNSTSGEIMNTSVLDDSIVCTAVNFEHSQLNIAKINIDEMGDSFKAGQKLSDLLPKENLKHVFVISDGGKVNGSELILGLNSQLPPGVIVTGGLAGDGARFEKTLVGCDVAPASGNIVAVGLYGDRLRFGHGSVGGWDSFGPDRIITKSKANVLYELDGQSALSLYKKYLGDQAKGLPGTALLFPLAIRSKDTEHSIVRTILAINEEEQSMTFAGDMPEGSFARLMKANFDRLIDGAGEAATNSFEGIGKREADLAILISCVGRKLVLDQRIEEEVEGVRAVLGNKPVMTGFYSYGELSPFNPAAKCELHNQTMTITTITEV